MCAVAAAPRAGPCPRVADSVRGRGPRMAMHQGSDKNGSGSDAGVAAGRKKVIVTPSFLHTASRQRISFPRRSESVLVDIPVLSFEEKLSWQNRLQRFVRDCGCGTGAAALLLSIAAAAIYLFRAPGGIHAFGFLRAGSALVFILLVTAAGKAFGLARARAEFRRAIVQLNRIVQEREAKQT